MIFLVSSGRFFQFQPITDQQNNGQVFKDAKNLEKFVSMRSNYVVNIIAEALKISTFYLQLSDGATKAALTSLVSHLQGINESNETVAGQMVYFDLAQSTTSWPTAWAGLLIKTPSTFQTYMMETVPVLQKIPWDDAKRTRERIFNAYLPNINMPNSDSKAEAELESDNDEGPTKKLKTKDSKGKGKGDKEAAEGQEADEEEQQPTTVVQLWSLNNFAEDGDSELVMMDDSYDAFLLQINGLDATFLNILQSKLQTMVWNAYSQHLRCGDGEPSFSSMVGIDLAKKGTDAILVSKTLAKEKEFCLMMAGSVSLYPNGTPGKDHYPLCSLFGLTFYLNGPKDFSAFDTVIPAWSAKTVSRNDLAFFDVESAYSNAVLYITDGGNLQVRCADGMNPKFRQLLHVNMAFGDMSPKDQEAVIAKKQKEVCEINEATETTAAQVTYAWYDKPMNLKSPHVARALEFQVRLLVFHVVY